MNSELFNTCKNLLDIEPKLSQLMEDTYMGDTEDVSLIPITHNDKEIILQFRGWSINLNSDGTWFWEDSGGG